MPQPRPWLADATTIAALIGRNPSTVRSWIRRGHLRHKRIGPGGKPLYDVEEAEKLAAERQLDNRQSHPQH
jgi:hypothetical protein